MKLLNVGIVSTFVLMVALMGERAPGRENALAVVPDDAVGFMVVHNLADVNRSIQEVGKLLNAPPVDVLSMAQGITGIQKGLDAEGDLVGVVTTADAPPEFVVLVPVNNFG